MLPLNRAAFRHSIGQAQGRVRERPKRCWPRSGLAGFSNKYPALSGSAAARSLCRADHEPQLLDARRAVRALDHSPLEELWGVCRSLDMAEPTVLLVTHD